MTDKILFQMSDAAIKEKLKEKRNDLAVYLMLIFFFIGFWIFKYTLHHFETIDIVFWFLTFGAIYIGYDALIGVHKGIPFVFRVTENGFIFPRKLKSGDTNNYISFNDILDCSFHVYGTICQFKHKNGNTDKLKIDEGWEGYIIIASILLRKLNKKGPNLDILREYYYAPSVYDRKVIFKELMTINAEYKE